MAGGTQRTARVLKGFRDYLPEQMILRGRIIRRFREVFERHGFEPLDTPTIEYLEVLTGKAGENEKLMYRFTDHGGREVGLRYDLTVPLARVVAMHQNDLAFPFKRYHIAPVWRADNPQRGRFREFWQCDADIAGSASMLADAEVVAVMAEALAAVGLPEFTIRISHRRLLECIGLAAGVPAERASSLYRAVDKLDKIGRDGVVREMVAYEIPEASARRVLDLVAATGAPESLLAALAYELSEVQGSEEALSELSELFAALPAFGVPEDRYLLDLALARGLDYYTGPVFEATVTEPKIGSVGGAGRYDDLVGGFLGRPVPATGMSLGLERIVEVVQEHGLLPADRTVAQVAVAIFPATVAAGARLASEMRAAGFNVDLSLQPNRSVGDQLKLAGRQGIPAAIIVGESEIAEGRVSLKDLRSGDQETVPRDKVAAALRRLLPG
ncbi:MAG: Histidyl-tRNA synthetase [uncultured Thermomicrobiales bacterium]|uniref:Histidine--tRNA ligase n=1 Tax=uncultured Thermomicrobiales bacterium TaxID=1645740 RepID=A0A6J4TYR3_9BACT|nr:MAG: Histidyl-tRNA synthetase [uncultured Thermomicrobiales bacterium]